MKVREHVYQRESTGVLGASEHRGQHAHDNNTSSLGFVRLGFFWDLEFGFWDFSPPVASVKTSSSIPHGHIFLAQAGLFPSKERQPSASMPPTFLGANL